VAIYLLLPGLGFPHRHFIHEAELDILPPPFEPGRRKDGNEWANEIERAAHAPSGFNLGVLVALPWHGRIVSI
jgi:hypothetical protein